MEERPVLRLNALQTHLVDLHERQEVFCCETEQWYRFEVFSAAEVDAAAVVELSAGDGFPLDLAARGFSLLLWSGSSTAMTTGQ